MNREAIETGLERAILALVLGVILFGTLAFGGVRPSELVILHGLILAATLLWIVRIWIAPKYRFLWPPMAWAILPFVGYAVWRAHTADFEFVARQEVLQISFAALLFLLVVNNLYSQEATRFISHAILFLAMTIAMYGIYQWLRGTDTVWGFPRPAAYFGRASGSFICPNHLSGFLEIVLPVGVALTVIGRMKVVMRIVVGYASLVTLVGIAATQSRAGWFASGVALGSLVLFWLTRKGQRWVALLLLCGLLGSGGWLYSRSVAPRMEETYLTGHGRDIRLRLWTAALQMWREHPWVGVGPDHFDLRYRQHREAVDRSQGRPGRAHNDFVNTLADYGAVGLALALLPLGFCAWSVVRCWPHVQRSGSEFGEKKSNRTAIVLGASAGIAGLLVHSFLDFNLHIPAIAFLTATLLAVLASHLRFATERFWWTARWPVAVLGTVLLIGAVVYLAPPTLTRAREVVLVRRAENFPDGSKEKIDLLRRAFALEPKNASTAYGIGEQLRALAWMGRDDSDTRAKEAVPWFERAVALNRWDVAGYTRLGMCLDWIGEHEKAGPCFKKALELDPNFFETRAMMGWHEFQLDHFAEARDWMNKSILLNWTDNPMAVTYRTLSEKRLAEEALARKPR